jgi:hypothetical protein
MESAHCAKDGFSITIPPNKEETLKQPPYFGPIIFSCFETEPENENEKESEKLVIKTNKNKPIKLEKVKKVVDAEDKENQKRVLISPPQIQAIDTSNY